MATLEGVACRVSVRIEINDEEAVTRCTQNTNVDPSDPDETRGWRDCYYDLQTREAVLRHWAFNAVANGVETASRLDGWADLPHDAVIMVVDRYIEFD